MVAIAGCGDDDSNSNPSVGALPDGANDPRAYTEVFLASNPHARLRLSHLAIMDLEPEETVDVVPYYVDRALTLNLAIDGSADQVEALVVRNAHGRELARVPGAGEIRLNPGRYTVDIVRARGLAGTARRQAIFLRPQETPAGVGLTAGANCVNCCFNLAQLDNQSYDGADLSGSTFIASNISYSTFRGANMAGCDLSGDGYGMQTNIFQSDFTGANLNAAHLDYTQLGSQTFFGGPAPTPAADLTNASFGGVLGNDYQYLTALIEGADFSNCKMSGALFTGPQIVSATFRGADLSGADFTATGTVEEIGTPRQTVCELCDFSVEPSTGNPTNLSGAIFTKPGTQPFDIASGTSFDGANLSGAQMAGGNFDGLLFTGANLDQASLAGSQFLGASFAGASLRSTDLSDAMLPGLDLRNADFTSAKLNGVTLDGSKLDGAILADNSFDHASLRNLNLYARDLHGSSFNSAALVGSNLDYVDLQGAHLAGAVLGVPADSSATPASLVAAYMPNVDLSHADLRNVDLTGAHLYGDAALTLLDNALLDGATMVGAICSGTKFDGASMNGTVLDDAQLVNCTFAQADLTRASMDSTYLQGADFSGAASVMDLRLSNAAISSMAGVWTFTEQNGMPVNFQYGATVLAAAASDPSVLCPNGEYGPCVGAKLQPMTPPYPPQPTCVPLPPNYNNCSTSSPPPTPTPMAP